MPKRIISLFLCIILIVSVFSGFFTVYAGWIESATANDTGRSRAYISVLPGRGTTLYVNVEPYDAEPTYKWYEGEYDSSAEDPEWNLISNVDGPELNLNIVEHNAVYTCRVYDEDGTYFNTVYFSVSVDNNLYTSECSINGKPSTRYTASIGEEVALSVTVEAYDRTGLTYEWYAFEYDANWNEVLTPLT